MIGSAGVGACKRAICDYSGVPTVYYIVLCIMFICSERDGERTGVNKEKELFAVMADLFSRELKDTYLSTALEQVRLQV